MGLSNWYLVSPECVHGMQDLKSIEGVYIAERILPVGAIVPLEWKGKQRISDLYLPADQLINYSPVEDDWAILYALWPSLRPLNWKVEAVINSRIGQAGQWASGWYRICYPDPIRNMSSVPYGYTALCDVEGICKAGDVALSGDIVPAAFFTGLSLAQFERIESLGLCSESWLDSWPSPYRAGYLRNLARPVMERALISGEERAELMQKYPALAPKEISPVPTKNYRKRN